jgi:hypothetical protein
MLEDIATRILGIPEEGLKAIAIGLFIVGGIFAGIFSHSKSELSRTAYFGLSALIVLALSASQIIWLATFAAMAGGYLWVLVSTETIIKPVLGFLFGKVAMGQDSVRHPAASAVLLLLWQRPSHQTFRGHGAKGVKHGGAARDV